MKQGLAWAFGYNILLHPRRGRRPVRLERAPARPRPRVRGHGHEPDERAQHALRLRRFRRPASAQEILHPPLRSRIGQYAYLTGSPSFALALGVGLTAVSRMDFAERGMNGTLAWMQTTGMPMRPAMSTMMTADVPPTEASDTPVWTCSSTSRRHSRRRAHPGHGHRGRRRTGEPVRT